MSEGRDAGIKLFGKTIQFPEISLLNADSCSLPPSDLPSSPNSSKTEVGSVCEEHEADKDSVGERKDEHHPLKSEEISDSKTSALINENPKTPSSVDNEVKTEEEHSETSNSEDKTLKKPDIILPCPRCNSMDTKFCYYNNYNVNQPRHFCKKCQRYWTAGGTMRNVPVGAGRRKNKNLATQYHHHHITVSEALQSTTTAGTVLAFGEPMSTVTTVRTHHKSEELKNPAPHVDNGDDRSSGSSTTAANSKDEMSRIGLQCFPGAPFAYPWNPAQWNSAPMPFYPVLPYWGCAVPPPGSWNLQWVPQPAVSSTLGKHPREEKENEAEKENNAEKCLWFPKTMRVDESSEAAASRMSLWATLGFENDKADCVRGGSLFNAFKTKGDEKTHLISESNTALKANPAAFSRSLNFHEGS